MMTGLCAQAGAFRTGGVGVFAWDRLIHMAPPAHMVPTLMNQLFDWLAQSEDHLLIKSCVVQIYHSSIYINAVVHYLC